MQPRSGFTLIELSIVLAIIGLIVGGILVGKDLIANAEIRATISVYQKLDAAVNTFKTKYNCLPGDCTNASDFGFTPPAGDAYINGDGNGHVDNYLNVAGHLDFDEVLFFFAELSQASLTDLSPPFPAQHGPLVPGPNFPTFNGWWVYYVPQMSRAAGNCCAPVSFFSIPGHVFAIESGANNVQPPGFITPTTAYQIDAKIDDGLPISGNVQVGFGYVAGTTGYPDQSYSPSCGNYPFAQVPQYDTTDNLFLCSLVLKASF